MEAFATERLSVRDWAPALSDPARRSALEAGMAAMLTLAVLAHLPEPLQLRGDVAAWIRDRDAEADVHLVTETDGGALIGALLLAPDADPQGGQVLHVGYFFAQTAWGKGYATELLRGLATALQGRGPVLLIGGVGKGNDASRRVLTKAGFAISPERSSHDAHMMLRAIR